MKALTLYMLLIMSLKNFTDSKRLMSMVLQKCTSHCNPEYCKLKTVCRPLNRTSKFVSMDVYIHPGISVDAPIYAEVVALKKFATVYRPHMLRLKGEICEVLALRNHPLFKLTKDESILQNFLQPCPLTGHRYTKARITNLDDYDVPQVRIVPAGEWRLDNTLSIKRNGTEIVLITWTDYYEVKTLTAEEF